jgi:hypothetical protein
MCLHCWNIKGETNPVQIFAAGNVKLKIHSENFRACTKDLVYLSSRLVDQNV